MVMDSLRYWVEEMHVDGFRFDLATTLAREVRTFDTHAGFLDTIRQDPCLARVKLIAEPWDLGADGYQVGHFPPGWLEWNDRFRDTTRRFWRGDGGLIGEMAGRLSGSADLFGHGGRRPWASVNFVTAHDGFTLDDLVSYATKHNEANGEDNKDGTSESYSWNCGVEGETDDAAILALRQQHKRNLLTSILIAQGTPMLLAGDELGNSQGGNNNAYCQDNQTGWIDWTPERIAAHGLVDFVRVLTSLRRRYPALRRGRFLTGQPAVDDIPDVVWLTPQGVEKTEEDWRFPDARFLAFLLNGNTTPAVSEQGNSHLLFLLNAHFDEIAFVVPTGYAPRWELALDTAAKDGRGARRQLAPGEACNLPPKSMALLLSLVPQAEAAA
jgi:glycogen operon protein